MESSSPPMNEYERTLNAIADVLQPILHFAPFVMLRPDRIGRHRAATVGSTSFVLILLIRGLNSCGQEPPIPSCNYSMGAVSGLL